MNAEEVQELITADPKLLLVDQELMKSRGADKEAVLVGYTDNRGGKQVEIDVLLGGNSPLNRYAEVIYAFMFTRELDRLIVWGAGRFSSEFRTFDGWSPEFPVLPKPRLRRHLRTLEGDAEAYSLVGGDDNEAELSSIEMTLEEIELMLNKKN